MTHALQTPHVATYQKLTAWKLSHEMVLEVYRATRRFPAEERFGLVSQARRAAYSIAANIAEGSAKRGCREFRRYLDVSIGSLSELDYALLVARDLGYIPAEEWEQFGRKCADAGRVIWGLYRSMAAPRASA